MGAALLKGFLRRVMDKKNAAWEEREINFA